MHQGAYVSSSQTLLLAFCTCLDRCLHTPSQLCLRLLRGLCCSGQENCFASAPAALTLFMLYCVFIFIEKYKYVNIK